MGAREVLHPSVWAHPYSFDATTTYEFVSTPRNSELRSSWSFKIAIS